MKGRFLVSSNEPPREINIYANKSALILDWLLTIGIDKRSFTLREVAKETRVSLGLVQKVMGALALKGVLRTEGLRTAKKFFLKNPNFLLKSWLEEYSIMKKCKMRTYRSAFQKKSELIKTLRKSHYNQIVTLALHSAAEVYRCKNTNLNTLELYMLDSAIRSKLEDVLQLEPQERGYEVLLIEPYYKSLLDLSIITTKSGIRASSPLLTFLDLYHFPLRGQEQAEFMAERISELKRIHKG